MSDYANEIVEPSEPKCDKCGECWQLSHLTINRLKSLILVLKHL